MDLLAILEHAIGHLLGREHEADGVMAETLTAGTRLTPDTQRACLDAALVEWALARKK